MELVTKDYGLLQWNESILNKIIYTKNNKIITSLCLQNFGQIKAIEFEV